MSYDANVLKFDDAGLRNLLLAMETKHSVQVGIFSGAHDKPKMHKSKNKKGKMVAYTTDAEIGHAHEFGVPSHGLPQRSWLRMPIITKIKEIMASVQDSFPEVAKTGDPVQFLKLLGLAIEVQISKAFDSNGFGSWAPLKYATKLQKLRGSGGKGQKSLRKRKQMLAVAYAEGREGGILVDSGQLRRAVSSRVL